MFRGGGAVSSPHEVRTRGIVRASELSTRVGAWANALPEPPTPRLKSNNSFYFNTDWPRNVAREFGS